MASVSEEHLYKLLTELDAAQRTILPTLIAANVQRVRVSKGLRQRRAAQRVKALEAYALRTLPPPEAEE